MTSQERAHIAKRMLWIIPAMIPCIIGDYCMALAPKGSTAVSFIQAIKNDDKEADR